MERVKLKVRALCDRVRRPTAIRILAGLLLMVPAALPAVLSHWAGNPGRITSPIELAPIEAAAPAAVMGQVDVVRLAREYRISPALAQDIHEAAAEAGVSPKVAFGLVRAESSFRPKVVSPVGAVGLTQVMPATARWLEPGTTWRDLRTPEVNLRIGFKYLRHLIDRYDGNEKLALTAFNRGPGTVDKLLKRGRNPDNGYAEKVLTGRSAKHVALMNRKFGRRS